MKQILHVLLVSAVVTLLFSCEDEAPELKPTASITVINAGVGQGPVKVNTSNSSNFSYAKAPDLAFGASGFFGAWTGSNLVRVVSSTDTSKTLFSRTIDLKTISTLYLAGRTPNIDTMFRAETNFPYIVPYKDDSDRSIYIRFINLSPNSQPLDIKIRNATTNEVTALPYKGISDFKKYPALATTANYVFEVRDPTAVSTQPATSTTVVINTSRYKTMSIVIKGLYGTTTGTDIFNILPVTYN